MSATTAIIKKEVRTYFYSPVAYVLIGLFLLIMGIIFSRFVAIYQQVNAAQRMGQAQGVTLDKLAVYYYQNMAFYLCLLTPFLTMKLYAEERSQNTLELLMTAPIRTSQLVFGKFLGALSLMSIMVAITFVYVSFMIMWGNPDLRIIAATYLGLFLCMACYISLGGLISAMVSSQAIAAILAFVVLFALYLMQMLSQGVTSTWMGIQIGPTLAYLSPLGHFNSINEGLIQVKDVVYFVSFTGLMLFLTHRVVESNRWR